jgi:hypothetical protein
LAVVEPRLDSPYIQIISEDVSQSVRAVAQQRNYLARYDQKFASGRRELIAQESSVAEKFAAASKVASR